MAHRDPVARRDRADHGGLHHVHGAVPRRVPPHPHHPPRRAGACSGPPGHAPPPGPAVEKDAPAPGDAADAEKAKAQADYDAAKAEFDRLTAQADGDGADSESPSTDNDATYGNIDSLLDSISKQ